MAEDSNEPGGRDESPALNVNRREALKLGGVLGAGALLGASATYTATAQEAPAPAGTIGPQDKRPDLYAVTVDAYELAGPVTGGETLTDIAGTGLSIDSGVLNATGGGSGGGEPYATVTVAASDAQTTTGADHVCDGTDDQVTINNAIASLPAYGGRVLLTEGTYTLSGAVTDQAQSNVTLEGQGTATELFMAAGNAASCIDLGSESDWTIRNLLIDGNAANQTDGGNNDTQNGIYTDGTIGLHIDRVSVRDTIYANIRIDKAARSITDISVTNCHLTNSTGGSAVADNNLALAGAGVNTTRRVVVQGNHCQDSAHTGIEIAQNTFEVTVTGNVVVNPAARGISPHGGTSATIVGNTVKGAGDDCIIADGDSVVTGNTIQNPGNDGVGVQGADAIVSQNRIINAGRYGVENASDGVIITNNRITGSTTAAIEDTGTNTLVTDNLTG